MGKVFLSLYIIPTYQAILDKTVFMRLVQLRDSSIIPSRNRASRLRSIGDFDIISGVGCSIFLERVNIIYLVSFSAKPLKFTHSTKLLTKVSSCSKTSPIVGAVSIMLASSA